MTLRLAAVGAALVAVVGSPAFAAAPSCRLLTDTRDDGHLVAVVGPNRPDVDIVSGDVATGRTELVGVLRVGSFDIGDMPNTGTRYHLSWQLDGVLQYFSMTTYADGERQVEFDPDWSDQSSAGQSTPKVVVDRKAGTITWTLPRKANPRLRPGARFRFFEGMAESGVNYDGATLTHGGDEAASEGTYVDRGRSCVRAR